MKTLVAAVALLLAAGTAHADNFCDHPEGLPETGVMSKHFCRVIAKSRADAVARDAAVGGPATEAERCYWALPELRDGCDQKLENPFYSICVGTEVSMGWCLNLERPFYVPSDKPYWEARIASQAISVPLIKACKEQLAASNYDGTACTTLTIGAPSMQARAKAFRSAHPEDPARRRQRCAPVVDYPGGLDGYGGGGKTITLGCAWSHPG